MGQKSTKNGEILVIIHYMHNVKWTQHTRGTIETAQLDQTRNQLNVQFPKCEAAGGS